MVHFVRTNQPMRHALKGCVMLCLMATLLVGCYRHQALYSDAYRSVYLPIFENNTFYRGVEFDLTEALVKEVELRTPYKAVRSAIADTELIGTIRSLEQRRVNRRTDGGIVQEVEITMLVDWEWREVRTGDIIRSRKGFEAIGRYIPTTPVHEPFDVAQHTAVERMARDITTAMQKDW